MPANGRRDLIRRLKINICATAYVARRWILRVETWDKT